MRALTKILGITVDLSELEHQAEEMEQKIEQIKERRTSEAGRQKEPQYIS
jgi:proteasome assembly chaperone (PAC2) family protein